MSHDERLIHEAVAAWAARTPRRTALVFRGEHVSYAALQHLVVRRARTLQAYGVRHGDIVPVCLPRSTDLVVNLLAVLTCGAAYAALDPRWPQERRSGLAERLDARVVVTDEASGPFGGSARHHLAPVDGPSADLLPLAPVTTDAGDPACVFFTSGTTGTPKGVVSPHRATTRLFGAGGLPGFSPGTAVPQAAPAPWDAFNLELWGALVSGGTSVIVEEDYLLPGQLREAVTGEGVNTLWLTASLFNLFVDMDIDCFEGVRHVYTGGERLSPAHVGRFLDRFPDAHLHNGYGPVESCVFATTHAISPQDCALGTGIPIGRPAPGTGVHILDGDVPAAPGTQGEVCVSGDGLALGYLGDPAQTAAKFADVVLNGAPVRMYRTGDLGSLDADGVLHFAGRADRQVKIRGYRIELGEIEAVVSRLDGVQSCTVVPVRGASQTYERLALFYTTAGAPVAGRAGDDPIDVYGRLSTLVPEYLVPDEIRQVDRFPFTPNGKLDTGTLLEGLAA